MRKYCRPPIYINRTGEHTPPVTAVSAVPSASAPASSAAGIKLQRLQMVILAWHRPASIPVDEKGLTAALRRGAQMVSTRAGQ